MLKVDEVGMIRRMGLVKGYSIKEIARRLDLSRNTVRNVLRGERGTGDQVCSQKASQAETGTV